MKVMGVYGKKDLDWFTCDGKIVSKVMNDFFKKYPSEYRRNYDKNLEELEIWKVDEPDENFRGMYCEAPNILLLYQDTSLVHEFMHMASRDYETRMSAFSKSKDGNFFNEGLNEGMTEYFASIAKSTQPSDYFFEFFAASMLSNVKGLDEAYFIPNYKKFISLFPNKRDIISLMYALDFYSSKVNEIVDRAEEDIDAEESEFDEVLLCRIGHSVYDVIDNLIDIQLSFNMDRRENKIYGEKFMDLLNNDDIDNFVGAFCIDYIDYANEQVKKRILRR